jgi:hypothetical protein
MVVLAFGLLVPAIFLTLTKLGLDGSSTVHFDTSEDYLSSHSRGAGYHDPPQVF